MRGGSIQNVLSRLGPDFIIETLRIKNVSYNWESSKYENKAFKQTNAGARTGRFS